MPTDPALQQILDAALDCAERSSWEQVRLHEVAAAAGLTLEDLRVHLREKEDLTDPWFDRADRAMLLDAASAEFRSLPTRARLHRAIMTWLDALAAHRRVTRQMILAKLEPGHVHIQVPAVMRISRTVQWLREAAGLRDAGLRRALAESVLTGIYLATFVHWMGDDSPGSTRTRQRLDHLLGQAEWLALRLPGFAPPPARH
ncbi:TetR family transcriptional regulator [Plasticicumulans lactativorans]|uniref:TetR family transcriptional regulator n=1 Tax=Plasticicumulans lactativorans TaxID=1133106 RepID=A0A4R2L7E5_9GAMM|nr:TetR/AcrR family transcriptional regulator [Plasticicumulans lactativorans]TCO81230.1 TetR family transcriptional regulator [Plasticicumulans lactativorans]